MGSSNKICFISGTPIVHRDDVVLFLTKDTPDKYSQLRALDYWDTSMPVFGKYDGYGELIDANNPFNVDYPNERLRDRTLKNSDYYYLMCHRRVYDYISSLMIIPDSDIREYSESAPEILNEYKEKYNDFSDRILRVGTFAIGLVSNEKYNLFANVLAFAPEKIKEEINILLLDKTPDEFVKAVRPLIDHVMFLKQIGYIGVNFAYKQDIGQNDNYTTIKNIQTISNDIMTNQQQRNYEDVWFHAIVPESTILHLNRRFRTVTIEEDIVFERENYDKDGLDIIEPGFIKISISSDCFSLKDDYLNTNFMDEEQEKQYNMTYRQAVDMISLFNKVSFKRQLFLDKKVNFEIADHNKKIIISTISGNNSEYNYN